MAGDQHVGGRRLRSARGNEKHPLALSNHSYKYPPFGWLKRKLDQSGDNQPAAASPAFGVNCAHRRLNAKLIGGVSIGGDQRGDRYRHRAAWHRRLGAGARAIATGSAVISGVQLPMMRGIGEKLWRQWRSTGSSMAKYRPIKAAASFSLLGVRRW